MATVRELSSDSHEPGIRPVLEGALEGLYADASRDGVERLEAVGAQLEGYAHAPAVGAWLALIRLALHFDDDNRARLRSALSMAPPRTRWLVTADAARLVWEQSDAERAWQVIAEVDPIVGEEPWQDESPMVLHAILLGLRLAAATGRWAMHDALARAERDYWASPDNERSLYIRIACADHDIARGRYHHAASTLARLQPMVHDDLRRMLLCVRMHALVACASNLADTAVRDAIIALRTAWYEGPDWSQTSSTDEPGGGIVLPTKERTAFNTRFEQLDRHAGFIIDGTLPERASTLDDALILERAALRAHESGAHRAMLESLLIDCDRLMQQGGRTENAERRIKLHLLWSRLVIDLHADQRYDECELVLDDAIRESATRGFVPLEMSAYDQRAVLRTQLAKPRWSQAIDDAGRAGACATRLLMANTAHESTQGELVITRALLRNLLPVFDRIIILLAGNAQLLEPENNADRTEWDSRRLVRWHRYGRAIHDYVEQSQVLALKEARRAYGKGGMPIPHRFALYVSAEGGVESPLPHLQRGLRARDAALQYFIAGRYLLVFVFTRQVFEWALIDMTTLTGPEDASNGSSTRSIFASATTHDGLRRLLAGCDRWLKGESEPDDIARARPLAQALLPDPIVTRLDDAGIEHLRVVPHDVLYRVPFGRLLRNGRTLFERFSLSMHPTANLAVDGAKALTVEAGEKALGYLLGPDLSCADRERATIEQSIGRWWRLARLLLLDTTRPALEASSARASDAMKEVLDSVANVDILHVACHGRRPLQRREAAIRLGTGQWKLSEIAALSLERCKLAILQSCWTGWMEHERANPVQGFPQALCDAGVAAVIAPLVKVPDSLTPVFAEMMYRTLRFLPIEQALRRTLDILREHGQILVAGDKEASRDLQELGPLDNLEYRLIGQTGLNLGGGMIARLVGRVSLWWWLLRRVRRRSLARGRALASSATTRPSEGVRSRPAGPGS